MPPSGSSRPASILSSVVLPAPFGPQRPTRSRSPTCQVTWSSSVRSPNDFRDLLKLEPFRRGLTRAGSSQDRPGVLFAQRARAASGKDCGMERFGQISGDAEIDRSIALDSVEKPVMMITGRSALRRFASRISVRPSMPGILRSAISRS